MPPDFRRGGRFPGAGRSIASADPGRTVLSLGMELRKQQLFALLLQTLHADGAQIDAIYERNDVKLRQKEGMEQGTGFVTLDGLRTDRGRTRDDPGKRHPVRRGIIIHGQ